jgi:hypothetical protein
MDSRLITSRKHWFVRWAGAAISLALILVVGTWGTGTAARSYITKRYPPPGRSFRHIYPLI